MFPLWDEVVAPVVAATGAERLVEIGALRGDNTRQILEAMAPDGVLHVVDPAPGFDPDALADELGHRYVFHRALSLEVLGGLPPVDVAIVDGDHNWYTVFNELRLLREVARANDAPLPVLILHDVGWPYGRRDLYYDPDTIPSEFRHPWARRGMRPGRSDLVASGGMSPGLCNATHEGGARNGVMTALDDWMAEHDRPLRLVEVPIYFGLAIVVETDRLDQQPELRAVLDHLESPEGRWAQLQLGERLRVRAVANHHSEQARLRARLAEHEPGTADHG